MKKLIAVLLFSVIFIFPVRASADQVEIERAVQRKEKPSFIEEGKEKVYIHSFYEYSWIKQDSRKGDWRVESSRIAYLNNNMQQPYVDLARYERFGVKDYTLDVGSYFKIQDGYFHTGIGFATDHTDFIYKFKGEAEIERKLIKTLFFNFDSVYLHHTSDVSGDVYVLLPALAYYFKENYISAGYGISLTQHRDSAQFGILKGNFSINERIRLYLGTALGERLFDIQTIKANKQYGSIFFAGTDISLTKNITLRIGSSYSKERPSFIKRSIDYGLRFKF